MSDQKPPVTVLGAGSMGSAIVGALLAAGHPTTVWNRSPERVEPLVRIGARQEMSVADAVAASPVTVGILATFRASRESMEGTDLKGRDIVTLNSGTPFDAREFAQWTTQRGARFLGGAIKNVPSAMGSPDTLLYFGGERAVFDKHAETLRVLGGDLVHLGDDPDLAALYESAVGATLLPTLLGFLEGAAVLRARGIDAASMVPYSTKWLQMIESLLPVLAGEIDDRDYTRLGSSVALFETAAGDDAQLAKESGVDLSWHAPMHDLLRRAVAEGLGEQSITALIELLATSLDRESTAQLTSQ
ncbi:NAD(P)-dependent oxidoreductase [Nocardia puris]|uniref:NAD(P)-dependent oxidoreductase n=1 Tax=Nocardia puris TaxID=208602 RepID=UPI001892F412|nr:NAD(P)-binding domain-containing protein [Nocardia puris]MBF6209516.1 NAD(P)-dependent oxidoreductase [Nocardia puris]MBF6366088.1 NAD(P)-dependent oxidoreductase [Nocardia puris]MBF6458571.1 NAD(P)-dependent oxidoreductase [Nocardia puris]